MSIEEKDLNQQMEEAIISIRTFARSFTGKAGIIDGKFGSARNPLPKSRVLFEINEHPGCTAKYLVGLLNIDAGYMSKIVKGLQQGGLHSEGALHRGCQGGIFIHYGEGHRAQSEDGGLLYGDDEKDDWTPLGGGRNPLRAAASGGPSDIDKICALREFGAYKYPAKKKPRGMTRFSMR